MNMTPLGHEFYLQSDVVSVARALLGKVLITQFDGLHTSGIITETEAYRAPDDKACHAYGNRRTARTEVMFREGGCAYIYLCYGIHHLFNVVTAPKETAHAVLIRAVEPLDGVDIMFSRRNIIPSNRSEIPARLTTGPGALSQALGLHTGLSGESLLAPGASIWIADRGLVIPDRDIGKGARIGVQYAAECAAWPWRFWWRQSRFHK